MVDETALSRISARCQALWLRVERGLWLITDPRLMMGVVALAWLATVFAPQLRSLYLEAHPEMRREIAEQVEREWGRRTTEGLELEMNAAGGLIPRELKLFKPAGVMYLMSSGSSAREREGRGCIAALLRPRVVLASARCVDEVKPDVVSWGRETGRELISVVGIERDPGGELALLKLSSAAPLPWLRVSAAQSSPSSRDELGAVLYLPIHRQTKHHYQLTSVAQLRKVALWVPQRSERDPQARDRALAVLNDRAGGALLVDRARGLEALCTPSGLIELSGRRDWLNEASEALAARAVARLRGGLYEPRGARPLASRSL
jgi:hypothetical protein